MRRGTASATSKTLGLVAGLVGILGLAFGAIAYTDQPAAMPRKPEQPSVFRGGVTLIEVDAVARDAQGRLVTDLRREEFELLEDGRPQTIAMFTAVVEPVPPLHAPTIRDVASNDLPTDGRLIFAIIDDVHTDRAGTSRLRAAARQLLELLGPRDHVGCLCLGQQRGCAYEFTRNHNVLLDAINTIEAEKARIERRGVLFMGNRRSRGELFDVRAFFSRTRVFDAVRDVSNYLGRLPNRRKAVVYLGSGAIVQELTHDLGIPDWALRPPNLLEPPGPDRGEDTDQDAQQAIIAAQRANVAFYTPLSVPSPRALANEDQDAPQDYRYLTHDFAVAGPRIASRMMQQIVAETGSYYLLGYHTDRPPGGFFRRLGGVLSGDPWRGFRRIDVRTSRPGVQIRARQGYFEGDLRDAGPPQSGVRSRSVATAVAGLLPTADLSLRATAAAFRDADLREASVAVVVGIDNVPTPTPGQASEDDVELLFVAAEPGEKVRLTQRVTAHLPPHPDSAAQPSGDQYLVCARLPLTPGHYQLRIGVRSRRAEKIGSVYVDVAVPDFDARPLTLSGLVLERRTAAPLRVAGRQAIAGLLPFVPSLERRFGPAADVWGEVRVYAARRPAPTFVSLVVTITRLEDVQEVWRHAETRPGTSFAGRQGGELRVRLPLGTLSDGAYRLSFRAVAPDGTELGRRETDFAICQ